MTSKQTVSFWGNYTDLSEIMALAAKDKIRHSSKLFKFGEINEYLDLLRRRVAA